MSYNIPDEILNAKSDESIKGKIMDASPEIIDKMVEWAARVLPKAAKRRMEFEAQAREKKMKEGIA